MTPDDFKQLLEEIRKLAPLSTDAEIVALASAAVSLLAFQFFDWRAVLEFLKIRENRARLADGIAASYPASPPLGSVPPRH